MATTIQAYQLSMEKTGKIEKTWDYNVYRIGKLVATGEGERDNMR
jgi:hypothetical protein